MTDCNEDVKLVAIIGTVGAGKSSFINSVRGSDAALVVNSLFGSGREVEPFAYERPDGVQVILLDTPGFGGFEENANSDEDIAREIAKFPQSQWVARVSRERVGSLIRSRGRDSFSGVILLHSIAGEAEKFGNRNSRYYIRMLKRLCGNDEMANVVVVTTRWDEVDDTESGVEAERRLVESDQLWKDLRGARVPFWRTGFFSENDLPKDERYQWPRAVVESLLGLDHTQIMTSPDDVRVMLVMGETRAGKSSFINSVLGRDDAAVEDGITACTTVAKEFAFKVSGCIDIFLVDTPGFNDYDSDLEADVNVLDTIEQFILTRFGRECKIAGVILLHDIALDETGGRSHKKLKTFRRLCGSELLNHVAVVTTRWDQAYDRTSLEGFVETQQRLENSSYGFLGQLSDELVPFFRTGHFSSGEPDSSISQQLGSLYRSPKALVENLLGTISIVILIGEVGSGKSTFINRVLGKSVAPVGDGEICTTHVVEYIYDRSEESKVILADTPGFHGHDKGFKTFEDVSRMIADYRNTRWNEKIDISGVILLHSITSALPRSAAESCMIPFEEMSKDANMKNVLVSTTRWDEVCGDTEAIEAAKRVEEALIELEPDRDGPSQERANGNTRMTFLRTGFFSDQTPQPPGNQFQPPKAIVERLFRHGKKGSDGVIVIMGVVGAGKSSFINSIRGKDEALVSDGTYACTGTIEEFTYETENKIKLSFVDTPGFNDSGEAGARPHIDILQMVSQYLNPIGSDERRSISGIIFLHNILSNSKGYARISPKKTRIFNRLCEGELNKVVVATTGWDEVCDDEEAVGRARSAESNLKESRGFFKELSEARVPFFRVGQFTNDHPLPPGGEYVSHVGVLESLLGVEGLGEANRGQKNSDNDDGWTWEWLRAPPAWEEPTPGGPSATTAESEESSR